VGTGAGHLTEVEVEANHSFCVQGSHFLLKKKKNEMLTLLKEGWGQVEATVQERKIGATRLV
jgi:hypothetical protein